MLMKHLTASTMVVGTLVLPLAAPADTFNYAISSGERTIHGTIVSIDGKYGLTVHDDHAGIEGVTMHRGTVIDPTGLQLKPGMHITIAGRADERTFNANEIDAPAEYLEAQNRERNRDGDLAPWPPSLPNGTFQTNGPSAEGGG